MCIVVCFGRNVSVLNAAGLFLLVSSFGGKLLSMYIHMHIKHGSRASKMTLRLKNLLKSEKKYIKNGYSLELKCDLVLGCRCCR